MELAESTIEALKEHTRKSPGDMVALVWRLEDGSQDFSGFSSYAKALETRETMLEDNFLDREKDTHIVQLWKLGTDEPAKFFPEDNVTPPF